MREKPLFLLSLFSAFILWFISFVIKPFNFWAMMTFNAIVLIFFAYLSEEKIIKKNDFQLKNIFIGIISAIILYVIFFIGRKLISFMPGDEEMLSLVYDNDSETPKWLIGALLFFPIGFAEELFWRGFIQKKLSSIYTSFGAVFFSTFLYTALHIPTMNPILILAAAVCGFYWGMLYAFTDSIVLVLFSHMLWDPLIFTIKQIR